jgi:predicted phage baseplate assembly protein
VGGGAAGNVGAGAVTRCDNTQVAVNNPEPARGGRDAEALEAALQRVPAEVTRRDRAVTADDFRALAEATPGAEIARAEVLPLFDPRTRSFERAGAVSVIVWPEADVALVPAPVPAASQRAAVCAWLDARRLVGTELFVLAPSYRRIAVSCAVAVEPGFGPEAARSLAAQILQRYVAPLPPDGPLGRGWPLGRAVRDRELIAAVLQVDGIEYVEALRLAVWQDGAWVEQATVTLQPWEVVELAAVQVVEASQPLPAPQDAVAPPPAAPAVAVPVIRDLCG